MLKQAVLSIILTMVAFVASPAGAKDGETLKFVTEAAQGGVFEVEAGNLAMSNASSDEVKRFGNLMVTDHGKANQELMAITQAKKMDVPKETSKEHKAELAKLEKAKGMDFDRTYMDMMVKDHEKDVGKFKKAKTNIGDPELKAWIDKTLPVLEKHLQSAQQLQKSK